MRWADYGMPEVDVHASLRRSAHRREVAEVRNGNRRCARWLTFPLAVLGFVVLLSAVTYDGLNMGLQLARVGIGIALILPWLATFDVLGEAHR